MRKLVYFVGVSIDGYIAGPGGEVDFYPVGDDMKEWFRADYPETLPTHVRPYFGIPESAPNRHFDTLVMGRGTYDPALEIGVTSPYAHMRQYIVSRSLGEIADPSVELVPGDPVGLVRELKKEEGLDIWLAGGGNLAGQLLGEIDALVVKGYPVVAGDGVRAFTGGFDPTRFTPTRRLDFADGTQVTWFTRA
ncbi:dihydrofolate reductase family protein [Nocardia puris]|uniref:Dihydrofolate reductase n=1 Tax=Nocardia puris TaxID=208602 RepID=A0A366D440_9NOCA|nr:dihydrofolate reductase family protein [Nocardia puris]RBO84224.1 dihydrofolate reductase [Nocardia puris]